MIWTCWSIRLRSYDWHDLRKNTAFFPVTAPVLTFTLRHLRPLTLDYAAPQHYITGKRGIFTVGKAGRTKG